MAGFLLELVAGFVGIRIPPYPEAGVPYYRFLFRVTPRTAYWIVYRVYEDEGLVRVLQFRSTSQNDMF